MPLRNKMDQEIALVINRALCHQPAPAQIMIMNAKRNAKGATMAITAITDQNTKAVMALRYRDIICIAARTVDNGVVDVDKNESYERIKIHIVLLVQNMGKGTESQQKM